MNNAIIVDLDGTLSNTSEFEHLLKGKKKNWKAWFESIPHHPVNEWCREIINEFKDVDIIYLTSRSEDHRTETEEWLAKNNLDNGILLMRKSKDYRPSPIVKREIYINEVMNKYNILFCLEDRSDVCEMYRGDFNLTVLQCKE